MDLLHSRRAELETSALPSYLVECRWFGRKDERLSSCRIACMSRLADDPAIVLCELETTSNGPAGQSPERWLLPLAIIWADDELRPLSQELAIADVSFDGAAGLLTDASRYPRSRAACSKAYRRLRALRPARAKWSSRTVKRSKYGCRRRTATLSLGCLPDQSNSSLIVGRSVMLKIFRRVAGGPHAEAEISRYLTEGGFGNSPRLLGEVTRIDGAGQRHSLAVAQAFVPNQGDAWTWMQQQSSCERLDAAPAAEAPTAVERTAANAWRAAIGRRLGEMHVVLARQTDNPAFSPRAARPEDVAAWVAGAERGVEPAHTRHSPTAPPRAPT